MRAESKLSSACPLNMASTLMVLAMKISSIFKKNTTGLLITAVVLLATAKLLTAYQAGNGKIKGN